MIARRRAEPGDDIVTALLEAEEAGDKLSEDEVIGMIALLIRARDTKGHLALGAGAHFCLGAPLALRGCACCCHPEGRSRQVLRSGPV